MKLRIPNQTYKKGLGLGTKFSILVASILVGTLGINTYNLIITQNELFSEQLEQRGALLGYFTSVISPDAILSYDFETLNHVMRDVTSQNDVAYAVIINPQGIPMTSHLDHNDKFIIDAIASTQSKNVLNIIKYVNTSNRVIHLDFPILYDGELLGTVLLGISKDVIEKQAGSIVQRQLIVSGLLIILLVVVIYLVFYKSVLRSIRTLVDGYGDVVSGTFHKPLPVRSRDELGFLTDSFNKMVKTLQVESNEKERALEDLGELNSSLEALVEEQVSELRSKEARLSAIFDHINDGIVVVDEKGFIESINRSASIIFSATVEDVLGLHFGLFLEDEFELLDNKDKDYIDEIDGPFSLELISNPIEYQAHRMNNEHFPMELIGTSMVLGHRRYRICVIRDITERKETEYKLDLAQQQLVESAHKSGMAEIATGVVHNIGNILNSVSISIDEINRILSLGNINKLEKANQLLEYNLANINDYLSLDNKGKKLPEFYLKLGDTLKREYGELRNEMESLNKKSDMMREVIQTQQQYAKSNFYFEAVSIPMLVTDAIKLHMASFNRDGIDIETEIDNLPMVMGQKSKLLQVIINLLVNAKEALEYSEDKSERRLILISAVMDEKFILLSIKDNGQGISAENLDNIFSHGFTTKEQGHGFGLHASANAMTEMKGALSVSSEGENLGACFTLKIPIVDSSDLFSEYNNMSS